MADAPDLAALIAALRPPAGAPHSWTDRHNQACEALTAAYTAALGSMVATMADPNPRLARSRQRAWQVVSEAYWRMATGK